MVGKLLANDFYDKGVTVAMIHVSSEKLEEIEAEDCTARIHENRYDKGRWI